MGKNEKRSLRDIAMEMAKPLPQASGVEYDGMLFTEVDMQDMISRKRQEQDQALMREEMSQPKVLGDVLDEVIGVPSGDVAVTELAYEVINAHGQGLVLGFREWAIIQEMVERAIRAGAAAPL